MTPIFHRKPEAQGLGMTSQRARDRLVERLRSEGGIRDERLAASLGSQKITTATSRVP